MKKLLCAALAALISAAAFADGLFTVTLDAALDAFYTRIFTGDYAEKELPGGSPYHYQGEGDVRMFGGTVFDDALNARIKFAYSNEVFGGQLQLRAESGTATLGDWQAWLHLGEQHVRVLTGNMAQRGQVEQYENFDDFLRSRVDWFGILLPTWKRNPDVILANNFDSTAEFPYGYYEPIASYGYADLQGTDANDLFMPAGSTTRQPLGFLVDVDFAPVTVSASVGGLYESLSLPFRTPWESGENRTTHNYYDNQNDPVLKTKLNFALRAEGAKIADMVTAAAVYKYAASSLEKAEFTPGGVVNGGALIEEKIGNHAFGLYANVTLPMLPDLGISVGYSGLVKTWKNPKYKGDGSTGTTVPEGSKEDYEAHRYSQGHGETVFPFYNGIDLRVSYTGIPDLSLTLNNNISFATMKGTDNREERYALGWAYSGELNAPEDALTPTSLRKERYIGVYNALGGQYQLSSVFTIDVEAANRLAIFTLIWEKPALKAITNSFSAYAGVVYTVYEKEGFSAGIRGGLAVKWNSYSYLDKPDRAEPAKAGYVDFGIPVAVKVEF